MLEYQENICNDFDINNWVDMFYDDIKTEDQPWPEQITLQDTKEKAAI